MRSFNFEEYRQFAKACRRAGELLIARDHASAQAVEYRGSKIAGAEATAKVLDASASAAERELDALAAHVGELQAKCAGIPKDTDSPLIAHKRGRHCLTLERCESLSKIVASAAPGSLGLAEQEQHLGILRNRAQREAAEIMRLEREPVDDPWAGSGLDRF